MRLSTLRSSTLAGLPLVFRLLFAHLLAVPIAAPAHAAGILFLDRCVPICSYQQGLEDSRINRSSIISGTRSIPSFSHDEAFWAEHLACVRATFAPYDIVVTDVDPGTVAHWEIPVAGSPADIGHGSGEGGIAPFSNTCSMIPNSIAYSFAALYSNPKKLCWTTTHEAAHLLGLDHEFLARDPLTYLEGCLEKRFTPESVPCGEGTPRTCACGDPTQNSDAKLASTLGRAGAGAPLLLNGQSVSQDGFDEIGSTCQWTTVIGEELEEPGGPGERSDPGLTCGTESRLRALARAADAAPRP
jgi:hypothetical protein